MILSGTADGDLRARFAIDVGDGEGPERNEFHPRDQLGGEGGQKFPVPAEKPCEQSTDTKIDNVVGRRCGAFENEREYCDLEDVRDNSQDHGDAQTRTGGDFDGCAILVSGRGHGYINRVADSGNREQRTLRAKKRRAYGL